MSNVILNSLFPIFAIIGLGIFLAWRGVLSQTVQQGVNKLVFWVALPMLLVVKVSATPIRIDLEDLFVPLAVGMVFSILTAMVVVRLLKIPKTTHGAFIQASFRGNLIFIGLPIILFVLPTIASSAKVAKDLEGLAYLTLVPMIILYNISAVLILVFHGKHSSNKHPIINALLNLGRNPIILSSLAGLIISHNGWRIPVSIERTCSLVGSIALPVALLGIGSQLYRIKLHKHLWQIMPAVGIKLVVTPLVAFAAAKLLGADSVTIRVVLLFATAPTAITSFVMAEQMGNDGPFAAGAVTLTTACSIVSFAIILIMPL